MREIRYVGDHPAVWVPDLGRWAEHGQSISVPEAFAARAIEQVGVWETVAPEDPPKPKGRTNKRGNA